MVYPLEPLIIMIFMMTMMKNYLISGISFIMIISGSDISSGTGHYF